MTIPNKKKINFFSSQPLTSKKESIVIDYIASPRREKLRIYRPSLKKSDSKSESKSDSFKIDHFRS